MYRPEEPASAPLSNVPLFAGKPLALCPLTRSSQKICANSAPLSVKNAPQTVRCIRTPTASSVPISAAPAQPNARLWPAENQKNPVLSAQAEQILFLVLGKDTQEGSSYVSYIIQHSITGGFDLGDVCIPFKNIISV
jgi:hypothetical protein